MQSTRGFLAGFWVIVAVAGAAFPQSQIGGQSGGGVTPRSPPGMD